MKWKYDSKHKYYWTNESTSLAGPFRIEKEGDHYRLKQDFFKTIGFFKKLSSAKKVAELLING